MSGFIIDESITGFASKEKLEFLAGLATTVPENGWIVEVGSYLGRTSYALGMNKKDSVKLTCIDRFRTVPISENCLGKSAGTTVSYKKWENNVKDVTNIDSLRVILPITSEFFAPTKNANLVFIDAGHTYEMTLYLLEFWHKYSELKSVIVVDDYNEQKFPGVVQAVNEHINNISGKLVTHSSGLVYFVKGITVK